MLPLISWIQAPSVLTSSTDPLTQSTYIYMYKAPRFLLVAQILSPNQPTHVYMYKAPRFLLLAQILSPNQEYMHNAPRFLLVATYTRMYGCKY